MPRYRFEAVFHMCTYAQYNDVSQFPNRYDDRRTLHCNLINVYDQLSAFVMRYLPDRFFLPSGSNQREDLRWNLFREIVGNLCVHTDFSSGYACFFHVFKDRVVTKNPTRLMPEIPEGDLTLEQLNNYTKNPLLVRVFHELNWAEDLGSGTRNILRYAPLYYPDYKVEINSGSQFIFSITYQDSPVENVRNSKKMSLTNVPETREMSQAEAENVPELTLEELALPLLPVETKSVKEKKNRSKQAIVSLMAQNPHISSEVIAEKLDVNERTIKRDIKDLREHGIIERVGGDYGGKWLIKKSKQ